MCNASHERDVHQINEVKWNVVILIIAPTFFLILIFFNFYQTTTNSQYLMTINLYFSNTSSECSMEFQSNLGFRWNIKGLFFKISNKMSVWKLDPQICSEQNWIIYTICKFSSAETTRNNEDGTPTVCILFACVILGNCCSNPMKIF